MESKVKNLHSDLLQTNLYFKNYKILFLSQVYIAESCFGVYRLISFINLVKKFSFDSIFKFFMFKLSKPFIIRRGVENKFDYLFVNEINNKAVKESLHNVMAKFKQENKAAIFMDVRMGKIDTRSFNVFEMLSLRVYFLFIWDCIVFLPILNKHLHEVKFISRKYDIPLLLIILNLFDSLLLINVIESLFLRMKFRKIVLMSDVHKLSRLVVLKARDLNINTYVIQHGATIGEEGYLPLTANIILTWGKSSKDWFIKHGQDINRLEVVGSPRMDSVVFEPTIDAYDIGKIKPTKALIVLSDILVEENYLRIIRDAFIKLSLFDVEIIIKLHPGGSIDYSKIPLSIFEASGLTYKILRKEDVKLLLAEANFVFVTNSTVGMEAIVFNKPIFQFKSDEILNYRMSYEDFDCSHIFYNSEDICSVVQENLIYSKLKNYSAFISNYFYKLDGNSSNRIKKYLSSN